MSGFKIIIRILLPILIFVLFSFIGIRFIENKSIYYPFKKVEFNPNRINLSFEDVYFNTKDKVILNGWYIPSKNAKITILFCHGNAGNVSHRLEKIRFFHDLGCNVFIFDYRGYGLSKGWPTENGLYIDVSAAYNYLISKNISAENIVGYGESIGGAVIINLASRSKLKGVIIDSTFSSAKDMFKLASPYMPYWIFASRVDSMKLVKMLKIPKLFIHSIEDEIVPYSLGLKLYEAALPPKEFLQIRGGHNTGFFNTDILLKRRIADFLKQLDNETNR